MRICLISREFPPDTGWGGIATFVHDLAIGLKEIGHEVEVIALAADDTTQTINYQGIIVHRVVWKHLLEKNQSFLTAMPYSHNILKQISSLWGKFIALHADKPFDVVEAPEMFAEGLFVAASKAVPLVVRLYTPHFKFIDEGFHNITNTFDHHFIAMLERLTMMTADIVTSPSEDLASYICRDMGYSHENVPIVRDPVNVDKFCPEGTMALSNDGRLTVLFAGRLEARKGIYHLIEAIPKVVSNFPSVRFVILGRDTNTAPGEMSVLDQLQKSLKKSGCSKNVVFIPGVPNSQMPSYFRSADIFALPSLYDNAPFACLEAMSCGKPVICTTAGGMKEYVIDGETGLVVAAADADALAEAILDLLRNDSKRLRFGNMARQHVLSNFDRKKIAEQTIGLYRLAQANFQNSKHYALYRHSSANLLPSANDLLTAYNKMLYDLLYAHSWRFRLTHWSCMLRDRPRLTIAKIIVGLTTFIAHMAGREKLPESICRLKHQIEAQQQRSQNIA